MKLSPRVWIKLIIVLAVVVSGVFFKQPEKDKELKVEGEDSIYIRQSDSEMSAAMKEAKASLKTFMEKVNKPEKNQRDFYLKVKFEEKGQVEYLWFGDVFYDNGKFKGWCANDPDHISTIKLGDTYEFGEDQVYDWQYVEDGILVGGYTTRVLFNRLNEADRVEMLKQSGYRFE